MVKQIREMKKKESPKENVVILGQNEPKEEYAMSHMETSVEIGSDVGKKQP